MSVSSNQARQLLGRHGACAAQSESEWTGPVPLPDGLAKFYRDVGPQGVDVYCYGGVTYFPSLGELWSLQAEYGRNEETGLHVQGWPPHWFVVADDETEPYIFDAKSGRVLYGELTPHQFGKAPIGLIPDLPTMVACVVSLAEAVEESDEFVDADFALDPDALNGALAKLTTLLGTEADADSYLVATGLV